MTSLSLATLQLEDLAARSAQAAAQRKQQPLSSHQQPGLNALHSPRSHPGLPGNLETSALQQESASHLLNTHSKVAAGLDEAQETPSAAAAAEPTHSTATGLQPAAEAGRAGVEAVSAAQSPAEQPGSKATQAGSAAAGAAAAAAEDRPVAQARSEQARQHRKAQHEGRTQPLAGLWDDTQPGLGSERSARPEQSSGTGLPEAAERLSTGRQMRPTEPDLRQGAVRPSRQASLASEAAAATAKRPAGGARHAAGHGSKAAEQGPRHEAGGFRSGTGSSAFCLLAWHVLVSICGLPASWLQQEPDARVAAPAECMLHGSMGSL